MGWVILGVALWIVCRSKSKHGCGYRKRDRHEHHPRRIKAREPSASEAYRVRTEREDMKRKVQMAERQIADHDEYLRRQFQNL